MTHVIDACVHHTWGSAAEVAAYLPASWQEFLGRPGTLPGGGGMMPISPEAPYRNPAGDKLAGAYPPEGGPPGSTLSMLQAQLLDATPIDRAVLAFDTGMLIPAHPNHHLGRELVRAANDWSIDRWLGGQDDRLYGLALVPNQLPDAAADEIRRVGRHPRVVGVLLGANGLGKPFGHPVYHPIYEAAAELSLPLVLRAGSEAPVDVLSEATAGGPASTYAEAHLLAMQPMATHVVSMIAQGVFVKFPGLRVLVVGAGVTWLLSVVWRLDNEFKALRREVPWLTGRPSSYFLENVRLTTYPLDRLPGPGTWEAVFSALPDLERMVCFASGYPNWDTDQAAAVEQMLPASCRQAVLRDNAAAFFRWAPVAARRAPARTASVGEMR
jgi:predicted TIM-barrel fold metal-dependent hydrolase